MIQPAMKNEPTSPIIETRAARNEMGLFESDKRNGDNRSRVVNDLVLVSTQQ